MILSDIDIEERCINDGIIQPFDFKQIQPASYDFTLGSTFRTNIAGNGAINPLTSNMDDLTEEYFLQEGELFFLDKGQFALGITQEYFKIPIDLAAKIEGKSSLGRIGLVIHSTAGWIDPGYQGVITLELGNLTDRTIVLTPGMKIGQICFLEMTSSARKPYGSDGLGSKYQFSIGPSASMMNLENPSNPTVVGRSLESIEPGEHGPVALQDESSDHATANTDDKPQHPSES